MRYHGVHISNRTCNYSFLVTFLTHAKTHRSKPRATLLFGMIQNDGMACAINQAMYFHLCFWFCGKPALLHHKVDHFW